MNDKISKLLFITNRNVLTTSGELRLIKNRAESLFNEYNIITDFMVFQKKSRINSPKREIINSGGIFEIYSCLFTRPFYSYLQLQKMKSNAIKKILKGEYDAVVISGHGLDFIAKKIKKLSNIKIIIDVHGALEDSLELAKESNLLNKIKMYFIYKMILLSLSKYYHFYDGCFVVTHALKKYMENRFKVSQSLSFFVSPCATTTTIFSVDEYMENRKKYRMKYNILDSDIVFVYSGGLSKWQCIDETINVFKEIKKQLNKSAKLLFFSHNVENIISLYNDNNIIFDSYDPTELKSALCAGDYAFLLRENTITNNVAFPNKFLEYVSSGMKVISTPFVYEVYNQLEKFNLGCLYNMDGDTNAIIKYIESNDSNINWKVIREVLESNSFKETLADFVKWLSSN